MIKLLSLLLVANFVLFPLWGNTQSSPKISIGKREAPLFSRTIKEENVGLPKTAYYRIFFKIEGEEAYQATGIFGKNIKPYLEAEPQSQLLFQKYRKKKIYSYACLLGVATSTAAWLYHLSTYKGTPRDYFTSLGFITSIAAYVGFGIGGTHLNIQGDKDLFNAVQVYNRQASEKALSKKTRLGIGVKGTMLEHGVSPSLVLKLGF